MASGTAQTSTRAAQLVESIIYLIVVDFDGTITEHDTLVDIVQSHAADLLWQLEDDLDAGRITLRECIEREFAAVATTLAFQRRDIAN